MVDSNIVTDPMRMLVAAHELGHAVAWDVAGIAVLSIEVSGWGRGTEGVVRIDRDNTVLRNTDDACGYLAGLLAGQVASLRWSEETRTPHPTHGCSYDLRLFRLNRRSGYAAEVSPADARAAAHLVVRQQWPTILRLAPRLAARGRITL